MRLLRIETLAELRHCAPAWDDLWWRSDSVLPTHRAELLAQWLEHFGRGRFALLAVEADGQLVAALPLTGGRKLGLLPVGQRTSNCWAEGGTLLLDADAPGRGVALLAEGLRQLRWPLMLFDAIDADESSWRILQNQLHEAGLPGHVAPQHDNGLIDITHDWDGYVAALSGNHRGAVRRSLKRLRGDGDVQLERHVELAGRQIEPLLHQAFEIEDCSWKGAAGTSVLRSPGMFDYFLRQSQQLAEWGQLELLFLVFNGRAIAFEYCYTAKGVASSHKIGYDEDFKKYGPGRLLRYLQLESYFADPACRLLDTMGVMCEAKAKWCTRAYQASRLTVATGGVAGAAAIEAYKRLWPGVRRLLRPDAETAAAPSLGAARALANAGDASRAPAAAPV